MYPPPVSDAQFGGFFKANPNQMALPGMEELSHPGARVLARGYHFEHHSKPLTPDAWGRPSRGRGHTLSVRFRGGSSDISELHWPDEPDRGAGLSKGEIGWVHTQDYKRGEGLATALYGVGREMAKVKPRHSTVRTQQGDAWARTTVKKLGGRVPKKNTL
jgi:hypothetical protein